ncbi:MAG: hypothetical protein MZW92_48630 [Comamonadaceae bacterium]|nr:hypothetical protein [Comamonadaceae bacterium]
MALLSRRCDYDDLGRRRHRDRGGVRGHGGQAGGLRASSTAVMKPGAILATNTSTLDVDADRRGRRRGRQDVHRHALLQPGQRDAAARGGARRRRPRTDVLATVMQLARPLKKVAVVSRRVRRLHRQPHARALRAPVAVPASRRAPARSRSTRR